MAGAVELPKFRGGRRMSKMERPRSQGDGVDKVMMARRMMRLRMVKIICLLAGILVIKSPPNQGSVKHNLLSQPFTHLFTLALNILFCG